MGIAGNRIEHSALESNNSLCIYMVRNERYPKQRTHVLIPDKETINRTLRKYVRFFVVVVYLLLSTKNKFISSI